MRRITKMMKTMMLVTFSCLLSSCNQPDQSTVPSASSGSATESSPASQPEKKKSSTLRITPKKIRTVAIEASNAIASERALENLLGGKELIIEDVLVYNLSRNDEGLVIFLAVEVDDRGEMALDKSLPFILFRVSEDMEDKITSIKNGEVHDVICSYATLNKAPNDGPYRAVFDFKGFAK